MGKNKKAKLAAKGAAKAKAAASVTPKEVETLSSTPNTEAKVPEVKEPDKASAEKVPTPPVADKTPATPITPTPATEKPVEAKETAPKAPVAPVNKPVEKPIEKPIIKAPSEPVTKAKVKFPFGGDVQTKPKKEKIETITAEVVDPEGYVHGKIPATDGSTVKSPTTPTIGTSLMEAAKGDRLSHNSAVTLAKMFADEFVKDETLPEAARDAAKNAYRQSVLLEMLYLNAQTEADLQTLGIRLPNKHFVALEKEAQSLYGITLKGLPDPNDPKQTVIDFAGSDIPANIKQAAAEEVKAKATIIEIPEADPDLTEDQKIMVIRRIFSDTKNLISVYDRVRTAVDWARKAYSVSADAPFAHVVALILSKFPLGHNVVGLSGLCNMAYGKFYYDKNIFSSHALLKSSFSALTDKEVAMLNGVLISYRSEENVHNCAEKMQTPAKDINPAVSLALINAKCAHSITKEAIAGILSLSKSIPLVDEKGINSDTFDGDKCMKNMLATYGSESIVKDKLTEIAKLYSQPFSMLSSYVDMSAFAK